MSLLFCIFFACSKISVFNSMSFATEYLFSINPLFSNTCNIWFLTVISKGISPITPCNILLNLSVISFGIFSFSNNLIASVKNTVSSMSISDFDCANKLGIFPSMSGICVNIFLLSSSNVVAVIVSDNIFFSLLFCVCESCSAI